MVSDGRLLAADAARPLIQEAFEAAAAGMPFSARGCTMAATEVGEGGYLAVLFDPE